MFSSLIRLTLKYTKTLIKNITLQIISLLCLLSLISIGYAAYTTIAPSSILSGQPVSVALMQQIKDNLDDLNMRINNITQNSSTYAGISNMPNNMSYAAWSSVLGSSVVLPQGIYLFQMYLCSWQFDTSWSVPSIGFISGTWYSPSSFISNSTLSGTCGIFYSSVLKVNSTTATVAMKLESYTSLPMTDNNPTANAFSTQFIRIQ